jgi:tetratricopeptide (TPR) repeat protein
VRLWSRRFPLTLVIHFTFIVATTAVVAKGPAKQDVSLEQAVRSVMELRDAGQYERALPFAERALQLTLRKHGQQHSKTADAQYDVADLHHHLGAAGKAIPLYEAAIKIESGQARPNAAFLAKAMAALGDALRVDGQLARAEQTLTEAARMYRERLGGDREGLATSLNNLALLYKYQRRMHDAETAYQESIIVAEKAFGPHSPRLLVPLCNFARLRNETGVEDGALALFERAIKIGRQHAPQHNDHVVCLYVYSEMLIKLDRLADAEAALREAYEPARQTSREIVELITTRLALVYELRGRKNNPLAYWRGVIASARTTHGESSLQYADALFQLVQHHVNHKEMNEAKAAFEIALAQTNRLSPSEARPQVRAQLQQYWGDVHERRNDYPAAAEAFRQALLLYRSNRQQFAKRYVHCLNRLSFALRQLGQLAEARLADDDAVAFAQGEAGKDRDAQDHLFFVGSSRSQDGEPGGLDLMREAITRLQGIEGPSHDSMRIYLLSYAVALASFGRVEEAEKTVTRAADLMKGVGGTHRGISRTFPPSRR